MFLALASIVGLSAAGAADNPPPPLEYADARTSTKTLELRDGRRIDVDLGLSWRGTTVYLGLAGDLVAVDDATSAVRWSRAVSPAWRMLAFCSDHTKSASSKTSETVERALVAVRGAGDTTGSGEAEYYEVEHGQQCPGQSPVSGQVIKARVVAGGGWGACATRFALIATTAEQCARVIERLHGVDDADRDFQPLPEPWDGLARPEPVVAEVDFTRDVVLAVCYGDTGNTSGITCEEVRSDEKRTLVSLSTPGFQTSGRSLPARPWILIALPRRDDGAYAIAWDENPYFGKAPLWHEQERMAATSDASLVRLPPRASQSPQPALPIGFVREIHHSGVIVSENIPKPGEKRLLPFETSRFEGEPFPKRWWGDAPYFGEGWASLALDWYLLPDGVAVPHGEYRLKPKFQSGDHEWRGRFMDGTREGEWHLVDASMFRDHEEFATYRRGQLQGPARILASSDGKVICSGQFDDGTADGLWRWFDANGEVEQEQTFDHGLWNGNCTTRRMGNMGKEAFTCVHGQLDGDYRRWYPDGTLAASGGWIAGLTPLPRGGYGRGWGLATIGTPGRRHGDWVSFARDGRERWRGKFDHGTGTLVEFRANGERWFSASFAGGRLAAVDEYRADGSVSFRETVIGDGDGDTAIAHLDAEGTELFSGIWRRGRPWSGTCANHDGRFLLYVDGKAQLGPPGMIREAADALERQVALAALRKRRGMDPYLVPATATDEDHAADRAVDATLTSTAGSPAETIAALSVRGAAAAVELGNRLDDADPMVRTACAAALDAIPAAAGKPAEGITIAAIQVGPRSQPGDAVSLLVTITNTTDHELCIFQHLWQLFLLRPGHENFPHWLNFDAVPDLTAADFLRIAPGASYRFVMDAEPNPDVRGLGSAQVALTFPEPDNAMAVAPVAMVPGHEWLISGPIRITYDDERADPRGLDQVEALAKVETRADAASSLIAMGQDALPALKRGLHAGDAAVRSACAAFICGADGFHPAHGPGLDGTIGGGLRTDLIAWWRRWGHQRRDETWHRLRQFTTALPTDERAAFQARLLEVIPWDHRSTVP